MTRTHGGRVRRPLTALFAALAIAGAVSACTSQAAVESDGQQQQTTTAPATAVPADIPAPCAEVSILPDEQTTGEDFAACLTAAMTAAGTGGFQTTTDGVLSDEVRFAFGPPLTVHGTTGDGMTVFLRGEEGWVENGPGWTGWVKGDTASTDPQQMIAGSLLQVARLALDPAMQVEMLRSCPTWVAAPLEPGSPQGAHSQFHCAARFDAMGISVSDLTLWLDERYLGVQERSTASVAGVTTSSVRVYDGWGEPQDFDELESQIAGQA